MTAPTFGIAVRRGEFQAQRIEYDQRGVSSVTPLCDWTTCVNAVVVKKTAQRDYAKSLETVEAPVVEQQGNA